MRLADTVVLTLHGELDVVSAPAVVAVFDALMARGHVRIEVVCHDLVFLDASGVGALGSVQDRLVARGGGLWLRGLAGLPYRVLEITGMVESLPGHPAGDGRRGRPRGGGARRWSATSLDDDGGRWRAFTRAALAEGVQSVLSTPLTVADRPTGALNLYSRTEPSFPVSDRALAQAFATIASTLFDHRDDVVGGWMDAEVRQALARRDVLAQAQGILMARLGIDAQHAFEQLRLDAIEAGVPVAQLAIDVVDESRRRADDHRVDGAFGG